MSIDYRPEATHTQLPELVAKTPHQASTDLAIPFTTDSLDTFTPEVQNGVDIEEPVSPALDGPLYEQPRWGYSNDDAESITQPEIGNFESTFTSIAGVGVVAVDGLIQAETTEEQPLKEQAQNLFQKMKHPILAASLATAAVTTWLFEAGPANENLRADVAVELLNNGHKAVVAGVAVGGITMAVEATTGLLTAATINVRSGVLGRFNRFLFRNTEQMEAVDEDGHKKSDTVLGLAGGSTPVVIERQRRNPERTFSDNAKTAVAAAGGIAAFSGALTGVAGDLIEWASVNGFYEQANGMKETLEDWKTWLGIFAVMKTVEHGDKFMKKADHYLRSIVRDNTSYLQDHGTEQVTPLVGTETPLEIQPEQATDKKAVQKQQKKRAAQLAGGIAFIGMSGPSHVVNAISNIEVRGFNPVYEIGGFLADNTLIDKSEDWGSLAWDWRIWTGTFVASMGGSKLVDKLQDRKQNRQKGVYTEGNV